MDPLQAVRRMCDESGTGPTQVSASIGRARTYLSAMLSRGNVPRTDTMARIAQACGYRLILESDTDRIVIDPGRAQS